MEKKSFVSYGVVLCPLQDTSVVSYQMSCHIDTTKHIWTVYEWANLLLMPWQIPGNSGIL